MSHETTTSNCKKKSPILYIFSGLPATGKTTLAQRLSAEVNATYLRIDTIEQALRDLCAINVEAEGYRIAYRLATDNLQQGLSVVADSCNPIELTRLEWLDVAKQQNTPSINIEVVCSDEAEHRRRVETRTSTVPNLVPPTWEKVATHEYHSWVRSRVVVDTAGHTVEDSFSELRSLLSGR